MTQTPEGNIAETLHDLSDQTRALVRREVNSALREMWRKAMLSGPGVGLLAVSGALAVFAAASSYRFSLRLLEKRMSPAAAAATATIGYGAAAGTAGVLGARLLKQAPLPLPTETATEATRTAAETAAEATRTAAETAAEATRTAAEATKTAGRLRPT